MPTLERYGRRIPLPLDAPPGAASAWRCSTARGGVVFVDRYGRRVRGSAPTVAHEFHRYGKGPPSPEELERRRQEDIAERRRWQERNSAASRADDATRILAVWVKQWRGSGSRLPFEQWLEGEAERLAAVHDTADEMQKADRKLRRREAEERAAANLDLL